jgi:hypothetical protein
LQPALTLDAATARNAVALLREVFDHVLETSLWKH